MTSKLHTCSFALTLHFAIQNFNVKQSMSRMAEVQMISSQKVQSTFQTPGHTMWRRHLITPHRWWWASITHLQAVKLHNFQALSPCTINHEERECEHHVINCLWQWQKRLRTYVRERIIVLLYNVANRDVKDTKRQSWEKETQSGILWHRQIGGVKVPASSRQLQSDSVRHPSWRRDTPTTQERRKLRKCVKH